MKPGKNTNLMTSSGPSQAKINLRMSKRRRIIKGKKKK
jgi:hypothetical protein